MRSGASMRWLSALAVPAVVLLAACGDDGSGGDADGAGESAGAGEETTTTAAPEPEVLRIHVTNDDGIGSEGIDSLVEALHTLEDVEIQIVAPLENQSGSGDTTTDGAVETSEATTLSGREAIAVAGFPADTVVWAHDELFIDEVEPPHLTVSGNNEGQNLGVIAYASGTVGAARQSAREGVPALAVSQGLGDPVDFEAAVPFVLDWVEENREAVLAGELGTDTVHSLNVPSCADGEVRGLFETTRDPRPSEETGLNPLAPADCTSEADPEGMQDVEAFLAGFATLTEVEVENTP